MGRVVAQGLSIDASQSRGCQILTAMAKGESSVLMEVEVGSYEWRESQCWIRAPPVTLEGTRKDENQDVAKGEGR